MKYSLTIYFDPKMHPETLAHNLHLAEDLCAGHDRVKLYPRGEYSGMLTITNKRRIVVHVLNAAVLDSVIEVLERLSFTGPIFIDGEGWIEVVERYLNSFGEFDFENVTPEPEPDFYDPIIEYCESQLKKASANSEPKSINRVYVSVFNERFLIDQEGVLYSRNVQGDINLCMHTEAGNLFTVIGWDLDGNPCTISDTYSLFENRF